MFGKRKEIEINEEDQLFFEGLFSTMWSQPLSDLGSDDQFEPLPSEMLQQLEDPDALPVSQQIIQYQLLPEPESEDPFIQPLLSESPPAEMSLQQEDPESLPVSQFIQRKKTVKRKLTKPEISKLESAHDVTFDFHEEASDKKIGQGNLILLIPHLQVNFNLVSLNVSWNSLGPEDMPPIAAFILLGTLLALYIADNSFGSGIRPLADALRQNPPLQILDLGNTHIYHEDMEYFLPALGPNFNLKYLSVRNNHTFSYSKTINALTELLTNNHALTGINLSGNWMGERSQQKAFRGFAQAIGKHAGLTFLDLSENRIGEPAGIALAQELRLNSILLTLVVSANTMGLKPAEEWDRVNQLHYCNWLL